MRKNRKPDRKPDRKPGQPQFPVSGLPRVRLRRCQPPSEDQRTSLRRRYADPDGCAPAGGYPYPHLGARPAHTGLAGPGAGKKTSRSQRLVPTQSVNSAGIPLRKTRKSGGRVATFHKLTPGNQGEDGTTRIAPRNAPNHCKNRNPPAPESARPRRPARAPYLPRIPTTQNQSRILK